MKNKKTLAEERPELAAEWHPTKNGKLLPSMVTPGSDKNVWWLGICGHEWLARISNRFYNKAACPYCAGQKVLVDFNDLATIAPQLSAEWHPTKNGDLTPQHIACSSHKRAWWLCSKCGHEWQAIVGNRAAGRSCPVCAGRQVSIGYNDLASVRPELAAEWHPTKNGDLTPNMVTPGSHRRVWWRCDKGHEWQASVYNRSAGHGCLYCTGQLAIPGETDLATKKPKLAAEWHPIQNGELTPDMVKLKSNKKAWWLCGKCGHEWQAVVGSRARGAGCPRCNGETQSSFPEQAILYYLKKVTVVESRSKPFGKEIDVYLPMLRIGIEHGDKWWHPDPKEDAEKVRFFQEHEIRIITVYGSDKFQQNKVLGDTIEYIYSSTNRSSLNWAITALFNIINLPLPIIDASADAAEITSNYIMLQKERNPDVKRPGLATEWHPTKNGCLTSDMVSAGSGKKVWWRCANGHEWQTKVSHRSDGANCPYCTGQLAIPGETDLATKKPKLAAEWHSTKNGNLTPDQVMPGSRKKVWWQCAKGHEWQAAVANRSSGHGCPFCAGRKIVKGVNDLKTTHPELAAEWHPTLNKNLTPRDITIDYDRRIWWCCAKCGRMLGRFAPFERIAGRGCCFCQEKQN